jgi:hypothetical protein
VLTLLAALALQPAAPPPPPPPLRAPSTPAEIAADAQVRAATLAYLAAKQEGRFDEAWAMLSPERQARRPRADWEAESRNVVTQAGAFRGRRLTGVHLLENPGGMQGYFAAVEFEGDYADVAFMCGLVIWQRQTDGRWLIYRESVNAALLGDIPNPTPANIAEGRRFAQCRD